jgi:hypothetical protein
VALDDESVGLADTLLDGPMVTRACEEWAVDSSDPEAHVLEQRLLLDVLSVCRAANRQDAYVAYRSLLIERPVLTAFDLQRHRAKPALALLADQLRDAYQPAPTECIDKGRLICCAVCRNLLVRMRDGRMRCVEDRCAAVNSAKPGATLSVEDDVYWLRRDLRAFIAAPGRTEVGLAKWLCGKGLSVDLWPAFDAYDLKVAFADGMVWAVDVKDWINPVRLARQVRPIPQTPAWDRAFFVVPQDRLKRQPDYLRAFQAHCPYLQSAPLVDAVAERAFLKVVDRYMEGLVHA